MYYRAYFDYDQKCEYYYHVKDEEFWFINWETHEWIVSNRPWSERIQTAGIEPVPDKFMKLQGRLLCST